MLHMHRKSVYTPYMGDFHHIIVVVEEGIIFSPGYRAFTLSPVTGSSRL